MVVAAFGEVSSAVDKVIHVYTCGLQSANLSQETGKPVVSKIQGVFFNWCPPKSSKCQIT